MKRSCYFLWHFDIEIISLTKKKKVRQRFKAELRAIYWSIKRALNEECLVVPEVIYMNWKGKTEKGGSFLYSAKALNFGNFV